ncbi:MAG: hypothetical protein HQK96_15410 [Nitrospirae bacterium]|nr:hypothetical protein [Nitrospirota bacterium]
MYFRISIDPGGEKYLGFAKKKLNQLKERLAGVLDLGKQHFPVEGFNIYIAFQNGIDEIQIKGIVTYRLLLIYIRDTSSEADGYDYQLSYVTSGGAKGKDYRALMYTFDRSLTSLKSAGLMGDGLTISDDGLNLTVQSGVGGYVADLPSIFVIDNTIDYAANTPTAWGTSMTYFDDQTRMVGTNMVSDWVKSANGTYQEDKSKGLRVGGAARHNYRSVNGNIVACFFRLKQAYAGNGPMWRELALQPEDSFYQLWENQITYRINPESPDINGAAIGTDYITGSLNDGTYAWKTFQRIYIFDENNALVKVVSNKWTKGGAQTYSFRLNLTVTNRWYADFYEWDGHNWANAGVRFSYTTDNFVYQGTTDINDDEVTRTEVLQVGGTVIETLTYKETRYMQGNPNDGALLTWTPGANPTMPLVSTSGTSLIWDGLSYVGGSGDGPSAMSGSVSGPGIFAEVMNTEAGALSHNTGLPTVRAIPVVIGCKLESTQTGDRDLHIEALDNYDGANNFIVMYRYQKGIKTTGLTLIPNTNDGSTPQLQPPVVTGDKGKIQRFIYYKTKNGGGNKIDLGNADIQHCSCQIYNPKKSSSLQYNEENQAVMNKNHSPKSRQKVLLRRRLISL